MQLWQWTRLHTRLFTKDDTTSLGPSIAVVIGRPYPTSKEISGTGDFQSIKAMAVAPSDPNYIYASVIGFSRVNPPYLARLFRTTNAGASWSEVILSLPPLFAENNQITGIAIDPSSPQRLAISFSGYEPGMKVKISTDAGLNWMDYNDGLPNMPCNHIVWQKGTDQLYVATDVGVYYRNGSMPAWVPFNDNLPKVGVQWLEINNLAGKIRAATYGRGLWESDSPPAPAPECDLTKGKVVFVSNRVSPPQLFVQHVSNFGAAPVQITRSSFPVRHPTWSPDGRFIAYIDTGTSGSTNVSALAIVDEAGVQQFWLQAPVFGANNLGYPEWSPGGHKIVVTTWDDIPTSELKIITFTPPYFSNYSISTLVASGPEPWQRGPVQAYFSPDGNFAYYGAGWTGSVSTLWREPVGGGTPTQLFERLSSGALAPIVRGFALSVSPDGMRLIYNSELYRDGVQGYIDEELLQLDLESSGTSGVITQLTQQAGNQYGFFAKGGNGQYAGGSNTVVGGNNDIFLCKPNAPWAGSGPCGSPTCVKLDIGDPNNIYNDDYPSWWMDSDPVVMSVSHHGGSPLFFGIHLPLTGIPGIECRSGGATSDYTLQATFSGDVTVTGSPQAQVTSGTGTVGVRGVSNGGNVTVSGNIVTIPLTNVANAQTINVTLNGVNGSTNLVIPMSVLIGDTSANARVNASDVAQTKSRSGQPVDATNFRSDVNANGVINASDAEIVKAFVGSGLP